MNAPLTGPERGPAAAPTASNDDGTVEGVARHVSAEGCQFLLFAGVPQVGQRMMLPSVSERPITGTIRWVLGDRIGFAFDRPIDADAVHELSGHLAQLKAVQLLPMRLPPVPR